MTCSRCGRPLLSVLEQTRGICASCHLFPEYVGKAPSNGRSEAVPPPSRPGESVMAEAAAGETEGPGEFPSAPMAGTDRDVDGDSSAPLADLDI